MLYLKAMFSGREAGCCAVSDPIFVSAISQSYVLRKRSCFRPVAISDAIQMLFKLNAISQSYVRRKRSWLLCCFRLDICQCYFSRLCFQEEKLVVVVFQTRYFSMLYLKAMFSGRDASCCAVSDPIFVNAISQGYVVGKRSWLLC